MFELTVERHFSAAHRLDNYSGACSRLHGHNYRVLVTFRAEVLDEAGFGEDFAALKRVCDGVLEGLDHRYLNEHPAFAGQNPTAEVISRYLYAEIARAASDLSVRLSAVTVYESETSAVTYRED